MFLFSIFSCTTYQKIELASEKQLTYKETTIQKSENKHLNHYNIKIEDQFVTSEQYIILDTASILNSDERLKLNIDNKQTLSDNRTFYGDKVNNEYVNPNALHKPFESNIDVLIHEPQVTIKLAHQLNKEEYTTNFSFDNDNKMVLKEKCKDPIKPDFNQTITDPYFKITRHTITYTPEFEY